MSADPTDAEIAAALRLLGLDAGVEWPQIREVFRREIRQAHPDLNPASSDPNRRAADLNRALATLRHATGDGAGPVPAPTAAPQRAEVTAVSPASVPVELRTGPGDVFVRVLDAAYELGDVSYIDPEAGLIQVLLDTTAHPAQLMIALDVDVEPTRASFTLDATDADSAPDLSVVVERLSELLLTALD